MKRKQVLMINLIAVSAVSTTFAQELHKPLLGPGTYESAKVINGLTYFTNGLDSPRPKRLNKKTPNYLRTFHVSENLITEFQIEAFKITEDPNYLSRMIQETQNRIKTQWRECGGTFRNIADSFDDRSITLIIEEGPFWVPEWQIFAAGSTDGRVIRISVMSIASLKTNSSNAYLIKFKDVFAWEYGNTLQRFGHLWNGRIEDEIGDRSPCGK